MPADNKLKRYNLLAWEMDALYHEISLRFGLTDSAVNILYLISYEGGKTTLGEIVRYSGLQKQTISSSLATLEKKGLVKLEKTDGRSKAAFLTGSGKDLCASTVNRLIEWENMAMDSITEEEASVFFSVMEKYLASMKESLSGYTREKNNEIEHK